MKKLPLALRVILNVIFYIVYVLVFSIIVSFALAFVPYVVGMNLLIPGDPLFAKIQIVVFLFVLIITLVFRKYFYLNTRMYEDDNNDDNYPQFTLKN